MTTNIDNTSAGVRHSQNASVYWQKKCGFPLQSLGCIGIAAPTLPEPTTTNHKCYENGVITNFGSLVDYGTDSPTGILTIPATIRKGKTEQILDELERCGGGILWVAYAVDCAVVGDPRTAVRWYKHEIASIFSTKPFSPKIFGESAQTVEPSEYKVTYKSIEKILVTEAAIEGTSSIVPASSTGLGGVAVSKAVCEGCGDFSAGICEQSITFGEVGIGVWLTTKNALGDVVWTNAPTAPVNVRAVLYGDRGRKFVFTSGSGGAPGQYSISDDLNGAAWVSTNLPGAINNEGAASQKSVRVLDTGEIIIVTRAATAATSGRVYLSTNNGATFTRITTGAAAGITVTSARWANTLQGVIVGTTGTAAAVRKTSDGGVTFQTLTAPAGTTANDAYIDDAGNITVLTTAGIFYYAAGTIAPVALTLNTGDVNVNYLQFEPVNGCCAYLLATYGTVVGARYLYRTVTGYDWVRIQTAAGAQISHFAACDCEHFKAVGVNGTNPIVQSQAY